MFIMRKWTVLLLLTLTVGLIVFFSNQLSGETTTVPQTTTSETVESTTNTYDYTYESREDLIEQLYQMIRAEIYDDMLIQLRTAIKQDLYDEIYDSVQLKIEDLLNSETFYIRADALQNQLFKVAELASQSVVGVSTYLGEDGVSLGSAVIFDYDPLTEFYNIITHEHVVDEGDNYKVVFKDGTKVSAILLGVDVEVDIAIMAFDATGLTQNLKVSPLGDSDALLKGTIVVAAGNPKGYDFYGSITMGIVAGTDRNNKADFFVEYIQHDAAINSGNSGGPLYNLKGEVIGINVSKYATTDIEGMGFAIPINLVKEIAVNVISGSSYNLTMKPRMGGSFQDISGEVNNGSVVVSGLILGDIISTEPITLTLPLGIESGLIVKMLINSMAMKNGGIQIGDLIVAIDDYEINGLYQFYLHLNDNYRLGDTLSVSFYRINPDTLIYGATLLTVDITLV
jgi:serine protease Do